MLWADSMCLQSQALTLTAATPADGRHEDAEAKPLSPEVFCLYPSPALHTMLNCAILSCVGSRLVAGVNLATSCRPSETQ